MDYLNYGDGRAEPERISVDDWKQCVHNDDNVLSDENGPEMNDQLWPLLQRDDPRVTSMHAYWKEHAYVNKVDWREKGVFMSNNTHLKKVTLEVLDTSFRPDGYWIGGVVQENFSAFCKGLAENRSIEQLHIKHCPCMAELMEILSPFIEHNPNLSHLVMDDCVMDSGTARLLTSALSNRSNTSSLTRFEVVGSMMGGQECRDLIASLHRHQNLVQLRLGGNEIELRACIELGRLLKTPSSKLEVLHLQCNEIDDECVGVLTEALTRNSRLKKLSLSQNEEITADGWGAFAAVLRDPFSALEALDISESSLDDGGAAEIAHALVDNTKLKVLDLHYNEFVSFEAWQDFFNILQDNVSSALEEVNLSENNIDDEAAIAIADAFADVSSLKILQLDDNKSIRSTGWQAISDLLKRRNASLVELNLCMNNVEDCEAVALADALTNSPSLSALDFSSNRSIGTVGWRAFSSCFETSRLKKVDLSINGINDEAAVSLANALANVRTLKTLKLTGLDSITTPGWRAVLAILAHPNSALEELKLSVNTIDDEGAIGFANALVNNSTLKVLDLDVDDSISDVRWQAFSQLVWNASSIMSTYSSNHTLYQLCDDQESSYLPDNLVHSLLLNRNSNKSDVARYKIFQSHFQGENVNIQMFLNMELKVMHRAFAWVGRDYMGHSLLYRLVRTMPSLVEHSNKPRSKSG